MSKVFVKNKTGKRIIHDKEKKKQHKIIRVREDLGSLKRKN